MNGRVAKRLRRENPGPKVPQYTEPVLLTIKGKQVFLPRAQRRKMVRQFLTDLRKGRIDLSKRGEEGRIDYDRQPKI